MRIAIGSLLLAIVASTMGCYSGDSQSSARNAPVADSGQGRRLQQLFGPAQREAPQRDIFFGSPPPKPGANAKETRNLPILVGIVLRQGAPEAFFLASGQSLSGKEGGRIAEQYRIVRIDAADVVLEDLSTGKKYRVLLTGS
jgi:hypothetical protein